MKLAGYLRGHNKREGRSNTGDRMRGSIDCKGKRNVREPV